MQVRRATTEPLDFAVLAVGLLGIILEGIG